MVTTAGWLYLLVGTVLFFFWVYGIASFALDVRNKFLPAARAFVAARRDDGDAEGEGERDQRERQLY